MTSPSRASDVSAVAQDYLKLVWNAQEWSDAPLTTKRLAERLGVTAGTVSEGVRKLSEAGLIDHPRYGQIALTDAGREVALAVVRRHRLIETLLVETFGYSWDEVHDEAEVLEHAVSDAFVERIAAHLGHPERDPHGDPIPTADGEIRIPAARPVSDLAVGEGGVVTRVSDAAGDLLQYFAEVGLVPDAHVSVVERNDGAALLGLRVRGGEASGDDGAASETSVPLALPAAHAIWVVPA
ncbi:iron (metal) dependent repressor, DtxR family [Beutenbergia cavernae DSM 12333]|uniref:Manganese transport regulator n=1 Tax=Beutenbergia cavernae (strain ATCC BAA-8 / DSM 12333 / CCUG 43141 / JCM 11478 / NBRC 16432 / NCIMB 13614 / HKI 0122) TaxID=471853 RepID=C5C2G4_BEUC1|nr:metal-dependent transcriptional regulator [Beutenbergia cavernae]ACQ79650.1 iron (metal) dependent repressor, DtxR family [Beutenbergia cavernae DSM 12333]